jgi:hypothetical protein
MNYSDIYEIIKSTSADDVCSICTDNYEVSVPSQIKSCGHVFHRTCIDEWFQYNLSCPMCRRQLGGPLNKVLFDGHPSLNTFNEDPSINLYQYIIILLSLQAQQVQAQQVQAQQVQAPQQQDDGLSSTAAICVFINMILERYKTAQEYNDMRNIILMTRDTLSIDGTTLPSTLNLINRTSATRELKYRIDLLRSQLMHYIWSATDPYHLSDPPEIPRGKRLFEHPYLQGWKQKIEAALG